MTIRLDCTRSSIVIVCTECAYWAAIRFTKAEAWKCAADHEKRAHPGEVQAQKALSKHLGREHDTPPVFARRNSTTR